MLPLGNVTLEVKETACTVSVLLITVACKLRVPPLGITVESGVRSTDTRGFSPSHTSPVPSSSVSSWFMLQNPPVPQLALMRQGCPTVPLKQVLRPAHLVYQDSCLIRYTLDMTLPDCRCRHNHYQLYNRANTGLLLHNIYLESCRGLRYALSNSRHCMYRYHYRKVRHYKDLCCCRIGI